MQLGSIWGHGAYQAPDWTADWLHRELVTWLNLAADDIYEQSYETLREEQQSLLQFKLKQAYRTNNYDGATGTLVIDQRRVEAITKTSAYYDQLFGGHESLKQTRAHYAMKDITMPDAEHRQRLSEFFFWTAWAAATERSSGSATERSSGSATYTNNWPHEPLIDNVPTAENIVWSIVSIVVLIAGVGFLI